MGRTVCVRLDYGNVGQVLDKSDFATVQIRGKDGKPKSAMNDAGYVNVPHIQLEPLDGGGFEAAIQGGFRQWFPLSAKGKAVTDADLDRLIVAAEAAKTYLKRAEIRRRFPEAPTLASFPSDVVAIVRSMGGKDKPLTDAEVLRKLAPSFPWDDWTAAMTEGNAE